MKGAFQPEFRITHRMTAGLTRIERARGFLEAAQLSEAWLAQMRSRAFLLEHGRMTIQDYEGICPETNRRTLQRDLKGLQKKGLIASSGTTNRLEYNIL